MIHQQSGNHSLGMMGMGVRNYIILVQNPSCIVQRIVASPPEGTLNDDVLFGALEKKWRTWAKKFRWPEFDIISGRGDLQQIRNALPACSGWEMAEIEDLLASHQLAPFHQER